MSFLKNTAKLASGMAIAQLIGVLLMPVILRLYVPEQFGVYGIFVSVTSITGAIACFRYEVAILLPQNDKEAANVAAASALAALSSGVFWVVVVVVAGRHILELTHVEDLATHLWAIPAMTVLFGLYQTLQRWSLRHRCFGSLAQARVSQASIGQGAKLTLGVVGLASGGALIWSQTAGQAASGLWLLVRLLLSRGFREFRSVSSDGLHRMIRRYRDFPKFSTWSALLNMSALHMPVLVLGFFFPIEIVGFFALAKQLLEVPASFSAGSLGQAYFQRASEAKHTGGLGDLTVAVFTRSFQYGAFPLLLLLVIGDDAFTVAFGANWTQAGVFSQVISLAMLGVFLHSPISSLFDLLELQSAHFRYNCVNLVGKLGALVIGGVLGSPIVALILFTAFSVVALAVVDSWLFVRAGVDLTRLLAAMRAPVIRSVVLLSIPLVGKWVFHTSPVWSVVLAAGAAILYYWLQLSGDSGVRLPIMRRLDGRQAG